MNRPYIPEPVSRPRDVYCINCLHCSNGKSSDPLKWLCANPLQGRNIVSGEPNNWKCSMMRGHGECGGDGAWFEPRLQSIK